MTSRHLLLCGLTSLICSGQAAPSLGQRVDLTHGAASALRATGLCAELSCQRPVIAKLSPDVTYLGSLDGGAFTYLVKGRVAMLGWMGRPHGESPLTPTPAQFNRLGLQAAGTALPSSWLASTWENWDGSTGLDPMNVKRVVRPNAVFGGKWANGGWYTLYIVQPAQEVQLRALINRTEPRTATLVADRFVRNQRGPLSPQRDRCPAGSKPLMASLLLDDKTLEGITAYFRQQAMAAIGCCGAPVTYSLPGLSGSSVAIETRNFDSTTGDQLPNACTSSS